MEMLILKNKNAGTESLFQEETIGLFRVLGNNRQSFFWKNCIFKPKIDKCKIYKYVICK